MATAKLSAQPRDKSGKGAARALRREGRVPAVIYGHGREPQSLSVPTRELDRLVERVAAASTVIELDLDGRTLRTLIREIQRHPIKRSVLHVDFQELVAGERVSVKVPLVYVGTPEGVRVSGGILDQIMHEVNVEADPASIPNHVDVDVSGLGIATTLHVSDLKLPEGVTALDDPSLPVCTVAAPRVSEEIPGFEIEPPAPGEPVADHPPLTSIVVAPANLLVDGSFVQRLEMALVGAGAIAMIGLLGREVAGERTGLLAAGVAAVYPNLWMNDVVVMAEALTALLVAAVLWSVYRYRARPDPAHAALCGGLVGLSALARSEQA